jgi:hypothetical protein
MIHGFSSYRELGFGFVFEYDDGENEVELYTFVPHLLHR